MILGALILILVHAVFFLPFVTSVVVAFFNVILLGIAFSLVPSAMWPAVTKIIPEKQLGSAYALIFWIQNIGLWGIPLMVGIVLDQTNPGIAAAKSAGENVTYNYTLTWLIFLILTVLAFLVALLLKAEDRKKGYGLELPNIQKQ